MKTIWVGGTRDSVFGLQQTDEPTFKNVICEVSLFYAKLCIIATQAAANRAKFRAGE